VKLNFTVIAGILKQNPPKNGEKNQVLIAADKDA